MARIAKGWTLHLDPRTDVYFVRFTHQQRRHKLSCGTRDAQEAAAVAAGIYSDVVAGKRAEVRRLGRAPDLAVLTTTWLATLRLDGGTIGLYAMYADAHWIPIFGRLERMDESGIALYIRTRLTQVTRSTLLKELAALRGFLRWCIAEGYLLELPRIDPPRAHVLGTRHELGTRALVELTESEVARILEELPERSRGGHHPRALFTALYETGLRRSTLCRIVAPGDYHPGRPTLRIRPEMDKARFAREVPLTAGARAALDSVCPEDGGRLFLEGDLRVSLRDAALRAGIEPHRAARLSYHDFRHARTTHLLGRTQSLAGVAFLVGHKQVTTTNRYAKPNLAAAQAALEEAFGSQSGRRTKKAAPKGGRNSKPRKAKSPSK